MSCGQKGVSSGLVNVKELTPGISGTSIRRRVKIRVQYSGGKYLWRGICSLGRKSGSETVLFRRFSQHVLEDFLPYNILYGLTPFREKERPSGWEEVVWSGLEGASEASRNGWILESIWALVGARLHFIA